MTNKATRPEGSDSSDQLGLLVAAELDAYYDGEYMDHSVVRERLRDFGRAVQAAEREQSRLLSDDMLRYAMAALGTGSPQEAERFRAFWLHAMTARDTRA
jgi:hypothetical protein